MVICNHNIGIFSMTIMSQGESCSQQPNGWLMLIRMTSTCFYGTTVPSHTALHSLTLLFHLLFIKVHSKPCGMVSFTELLGVCSILSMKAQSAHTEGMQAVAWRGRSAHITWILVPRRRSFPIWSKLIPIKSRQIGCPKKGNLCHLSSTWWHVACTFMAWGLFTMVDLPKDTMIVEYMGETVCQCIADKHEKGYETSGIGSCYNCWCYHDWVHGTLSESLLPNECICQGDKCGYKSGTW